MTEWERANQKHRELAAERLFVGGVPEARQ